MWNNPAYEPREVFLQSLHTLIGVFYISVLFVSSMISDHPLFLGGIFLLTLLTLVEAGVLDKGERLLWFGIWITLLIMIINPLVIRAGETILWLGPQLPFLGRIEISLEAICYGAAMGMRLMILLLIFCLYTEIINPDRLLGYMARLAYKSGLMLAMATRLFPVVVRDLANAREVQELRGVNFNSGHLPSRVKKYSWIFRAVLVSTLEGSFQTAEAMQARAFGSGSRSCYRRDLWRPRDLICLLVSLLALLMLVYAKIQGYCDFNYYPRLENLCGNARLVIWLGLILICLTGPALLSRVWKHSPFLRSRI